MKIEETKEMDCNRKEHRDRKAGLPFYVLFAFFVVNFLCNAQIQQAWVAKYNNGIPNGTNQAVKMALDTNGNIYVTGFSQNSLTNLGYVTIKYAPNGNQLWATRYDSINYPTAKPVAMALDASNNIIVTGSALTIKCDSNGNQLWTAPYAGAALAADTNGNTFVTGFGTNFNTVKLSPTGTNVWQTTSPDVGPTIGQTIAVDGNGNVYVAGSDVYYYFFNNFSTSYYVQMLVVQFGSNGNQMWKSSQAGAGANHQVQVQGAALDVADNLYLVANFISQGSWFTYKISSSGALVWNKNPASGTGPANGLALDSATNVLLVGQDAYQYNGAYSYYYTASKLNSIGATLWTNHYPQPPYGSSAASSIAIDSANNSYITGYSPGNNSGNDIVTIKYDNNGNQIWLERYNGPGNGDDEANAIAVDAQGNVYVTGYETTAAGGTEIVTIKYSPGASLQKQSNGNVLLQTQGNPGETFDFQASTNLQTWLDLGLTNADPTGAVQFLDTNASNFPHRFYLTTPQP